MDDKSPLRSFRTKKGMTLSTLAKEVGVSEGQLSRIEREGTHSLPQALRLAEITGLPVESFAPRQAA